MADEDAYIAPWGASLYEFLSSDLSTDNIRGNTISTGSFVMNHNSDYMTLPAHIITSNSVVVITPTSDTGSQYLTQAFGTYIYTIRTSSTEFNITKYICDKITTTNWSSGAVYNPNGTFTYNAGQSYMRSSTATTNYDGSWVEFSTNPNYPRTFYRIVIRTNTLSYVYNPKEIVILGRDGTSGNWNLVKAFTSTELGAFAYSTSIKQTYAFNFTQTTPYYNYRIVFPKTIASPTCYIADIVLQSKITPPSYHTVNFNGLPMMRVGGGGMIIGDETSPQNANVMVYGNLTASSFQSVSQYATALNVSANSVYSISGEDGTVFDVNASATMIKDAYNGAIPDGGAYGDISGGNLLIEGKLYQMNVGEVANEAYGGRYLPVLCEQLITKDFTINLGDTGSNQGFTLVPPARAVSCVLELWGGGGGGGGGAVQLTPSVGANGNAMTGGAGGGAGGYARIELPHNFLVVGTTPSITGWTVGAGGTLGVPATASNTVAVSTTYLGTAGGNGGDTSINFSVGAYTLTFKVLGGQGGGAGGQNITAGGGNGGASGSFVGTFDVAVSGQGSPNQTGGIRGQDCAVSATVYQPTAGGGGAGVSGTSIVGSFLTGGDAGVPAKPNASFTLISGSNVSGKGGAVSTALNGTNGYDYYTTLLSGSGGGGGASLVYNGALNTTTQLFGGNGGSGALGGGGGGGGATLKVLNASVMPLYTYYGGSGGAGGDGLIRISWY